MSRIALMEAMWCNYVTVEYTSGTRCHEEWGTVVLIRCSKSMADSSVSVAMMSS